MNILNNLKTRVKLIGSFLLIAAATAAVGIVGVYYIRLIDAADTRLYHNYTVPLNQLSNLSVAFQRTRVNLRDMLLTPSTSESQKYHDTINELETQIDQYSSEYEKLILSQDMRDLYDQYMQSYSDFEGYRDQIIDLDLAGKDDEALALMRGDAFASAKAVEANIDAMGLVEVGLPCWCWR